MKKSCIAMLLAGGQGSRLYALTQDVAKPSVPFGGKYRIIDFPLSKIIYIFYRFPFSFSTYRKGRQPVGCRPPIPVCEINYFFFFLVVLGSGTFSP